MVCEFRHTGGGDLRYCVPTQAKEGVGVVRSDIVCQNRGKKGSGLGAAYFLLYPGGLPNTCIPPGDGA